MNKVLYLLIASLILTNACGSGTNPQNNIVDKVSVNSNVQNANVVQNGDTIQNVEVVPANPSNSADANVNQSISTINRKLQKLNNSISNSNSTEKPKITYVPGPNNSGIATRMGDKGEFIQVRVFNSDPQIKSIEQVVTTDKLKIFLKNGKVLEVTVDKNFGSEKFINISPQEILVLAGLAKKPDESQTGSK